MFLSSIFLSNVYMSCICGVRLAGLPSSECSFGCPSCVVTKGTRKKYRSIFSLVLTKLPLPTSWLKRPIWCYSPSDLEFKVSVNVNLDAIISAFFFDLVVMLGD